VQSEARSVSGKTAWSSIEESFVPETKDADFGMELLDEWFKRRK
jgi:hypothetical protein